MLTASELTLSAWLSLALSAVLLRTTTHPHPHVPPYRDRDSVAGTASRVPGGLLLRSSDTKGLSRGRVRKMDGGARGITLTHGVVIRRYSIVHAFTAPFSAFRRVLDSLCG